MLYNDLVPSNKWLAHHGIKGQKWGIRRWQYADGSLTPAGRDHYGLSDIYGGDRSHIWDKQDYTIPEGTVFTRNALKSLDKLIDENRPYSYVYDENSERDLDFYRQFGKVKNRFKAKQDIKVAGIDTIADSVKNLIFNKPVDEIDIDDDVFDFVNMNIRDITDKKYSATYSAWDSKKTPEQNRKDNENVINKALAQAVARSASYKRNDKLDKEYREDGERHIDTMFNDLFNDVYKDLSNKGYSAIRDYRDAGGYAKVFTPTILFDNNILTTKIEDILYDE